MNSRERFLAALKGEDVDRTPLAHVAALTTVELQDATSCFMPEAHNDAEKLVGLLAANHDVLGFDAITFIINYFNEPAALGCEMDWGAKDRLPMFKSHPWAEGTEPGVPDDLLDRPPVSTYLEAIRIAKRRYGAEVAVLGKVMGPLSMTQVMNGLENTMMEMLDDPARIHGLIDTAAEVLIRCANAEFEAGADAVAVGEGGAGSNMVSPKMHEEFLLAAHKKMARQIDGPLIMHICGDITPRLHLLAESQLACFNFDWDIAPAKMTQASKGAFAVMGNINTTDLLRGEPADIERQVFENLEAGVDIIS
ncbi:MAG: uroporphyrinogen decarboxylase family protein, partial [Phycisphaerae bacterium]|nr:uroporphyrinogen decarboxylase family protein [Phycisphaerae bacterium]